MCLLAVGCAERGAGLREVLGFVVQDVLMVWSFDDLWQFLLCMLHCVYLFWVS